MVPWMLRIVVHTNQRNGKANIGGISKNVTGKESGRTVLLVKVLNIDEEGSTKTKECVAQQDLFEAAKPVLADHLSGDFLFVVLQWQIIRQFGING